VYVLYVAFRSACDELVRRRAYVLQHIDVETRPKRRKNVKKAKQHDIDETLLTMPLSAYS